MNRLLPDVRRNERGSVAVEFAVLLPTILIPLLAAALFFGRFFWHYTVAEKAAQDAARFVAAASPTEMKIQCTLLIYKDPCVVMAAMSLATTELSELNPGGGDSPSVAVYCDDKKCQTNKGSAAPKMIAVDIVMTVEDPLLSVFTNFFTGGRGPIAIPIDATARTNYVGN
jgi:Flp pilus assembly protein TadG